MATKTEPKAKDRVACECSKFSVRVNVRFEDGQWVWDEEITTGCASTTVNTFAPGHDAKLKSFLIKSYLTYRGECGRTDEDGGRITGSALEFARAHGFSVQVAAGVQNEINRSQERRRRQVVKEMNKLLRSNGESEETAAVMLALQSFREGDLPGSAAGETFCRDSVEAYAADAKRWLGDATELTGSQIDNADYQVAYDWFIHGI